MTTLDWLLLALVALAAVAAIRHWRKKDSCGCSGDCRHCTGGCPKKES
ncbi:FeoB-associated Cys-rich membrane protein [Dysosmobacter sp.]